MRRRRVLLPIGALIAAVAAVLLLGFTDSFGTDAVLASRIGGWSADGADRSTFWDSPVFDVPGASLTALHCHGSVEYVFQLGATGPNKTNPCYAAMGAYSGNTSELDTFMPLPGDKAVYRSSRDYSPWHYCIGDLIFAPPAADLAPAADMQPHPC